MNDYAKITTICLACVLVIFVYGIYRCNNSSFVDPLTIAFAPSPLDKYLDGWGISHLLFFAILGYLFPTKLLFSFFLGALWELLEYSMGNRPIPFIKCKHSLKTHKGEDWWYGRWEDIVMNTAGLWIGSALRTRV